MTHNQDHSSSGTRYATGDLHDVWHRFPNRAWPGEAADEDLALLGWIGPLAVSAQEELRRRLTESLPETPLSDHSPAILALSSPRFLAMVKPMLVEEMKAVRGDGEPDGSDTGVRGFERFTASLRDPDAAVSLLRKYPALARELSAEFDRWTEFRMEFVTRLVADLPLIRAELSVTALSSSDVEAVDFGAGDAHNGGRAVAIVTFRGGHKIVYKPRSLACDMAFARFVDWLGDKGLTHRLRPARVLDRGTHGWSAHYAPLPCTDHDGLRRFYWRQGAFLAVFHLLRGYDMHFQNQVAVGEDPVYFDLEALFHTESSDPGWLDDAEDVVARRVRESVLAVGLLPHRLVRTDENGVRAMEMSGLAGGAAPGEFWAHPRTEYRDPGTDRMTPVSVFHPVGEYGNRPTLAGRRHEPQEMAADLVSGFTHCYRLLLAQRPALSQPDGPLARFSGVPVRAVLRDTFQYRSVLTESWNPDLLADEEEHRIHLRSLARHDDGNAVEDSEWHQLACGDIPSFQTTPDSTDIADHNGTLERDFFTRTGADGVQDRLAAFSEEDLREQIWFVQTSFSSRQEGGHQSHLSSPSAPGSTAAGLDPDLALSAARAIGDRICDSVILGDDGLVEWPSLSMVADRYWLLESSGMGLYRGVSGIALFLAELGRATGTARYRVLAQDILAALLDPDDMPEPGELAGLGIGAYAELGGVLHLLTRTGEIWDAPELLRSARRLVPAFTAALDTPQPLDVAAGVAGAALALVALQRTDPGAQALCAIRAAGTALSDMTESGVPGFAHGLSGRAYALTAVADMTADPALMNLASETRERVAGLSLDAVSWCRGNAGLVMAEAGGRQLLDSSHRRPPHGLDLVVAATVRGVQNDSLCHGTSGLVEALLTTAEHTGNEELLRVAHDAAASVARRVLADRVMTGVPQATWTPGLLDGAAGIGYGLLRTAAPHRVPNILLMSTP
ncbi:type 2 lanthipeptide synthetase LanM [Streptomyces anulatus]|uniref:type 2 lanthipeptide synthetase LanM n=1 Tax=Streptomyces anulatus TaxID=1892 RepID=UPI0033D2A2C9|nr:type 2 lanthipeptide synthetase LanM [Streptomyces anulatus]WSU32619.1 type 2 lanthipeptide synthetase LanM [Streptomyces anulatus]WSU88530.1 type 2 lanthipeptide synthetase LanM [Streptomyces anulatus]